MAGLGLNITKRGFRSSPFTTQHRVTTLVAVEHRAFQARYAGIFNDAWRHYDVLANVAFLHPALQNFFGLSNETIRDTALPLKYYRVRYSYTSADLMLRKRAIHNKFSIAAGPSIFYYWNNNDRNTGRILDYATDYGLDSFRVFTPKFYAGGKLAIDFRSIDNILLPTRGIRFHADGLAQTGLNEETLPYFRAVGDLTVFAPLSDNKRFILSLRGGGGHIFSEGAEYWQMLTLGANNYLRGYRKDRYSGTSLAYGSAELRWRVARFKTKLLPGELGLIGFQDVGRVWLRGERSNKWHTAYGGGVYFTPFNSVLISVMGAMSDEEQLLNVSVGTGLNIVF
jgi:outer membrane protein assembly factor BamA